MNEILSVFGVNWKLLLIQTVNFGILLAVLWRFLYRPLMGMLDQRQKEVAEGLDNAARAKDELAAMETRRKESERQALTQSDTLLKEARMRGQEIEKESAREAEERSARILNDAAKAAAEEKSRMLKESREELARLAVLGAEKILREKNR